MHRGADSRLSLYASLGVATCAVVPSAGGLSSAAARPARPCIDGAGNQVVLRSHETKIVKRAKGRGEIFTVCSSRHVAVTTVVRRSGQPSPAFAAAGRWVVIERAERPGCAAPRSVQSIAASSGRVAFAVTARTCHIGVRGHDNGSGVVNHGPVPPTALDDGPAPAARGTHLLGVYIATDGDFAWTAEGPTYPGSFDEMDFGRTAAGLFVPAGGGHDTHLQITTTAHGFPGLVVHSSTLTWNAPTWSYQMPAPGSPLLPIGIGGDTPQVGNTPSGPG